MSGSVGKVGDAAHFLEQLLVLEALLERDEVNRLPVVVHLHQRGEDGLVAQVVEDLGPALELLDALAHAIVGREQHASQHPLLCLGRMWRQPVHFRGIGKRRFSAGRPL